MAAPLTHAPRRQSVVSVRGRIWSITGCGAAWLARLTGGQEVGSSNLPSPTEETGVTRESGRLSGAYRGSNACARRSTVSRCMLGSTAEYTSSVTRIEECPSRSWTTLGWAPARSMAVACEWRSWRIVIRGRPASFGPTSEKDAQPVGMNGSTKLVGDNPFAVLPSLSRPEPFLELPGSPFLQRLHGSAIELDRPPRGGCFG